ncbi:ATP-grasp domain-containing protein [Trichoderma barbatum]
MPLFPYVYKLTLEPNSLIVNDVHGVSQHNSFKIPRKQEIFQVHYLPSLPGFYFTSLLEQTAMTASATGDNKQMFSHVSIHIKDSKRLEEVVSLLRLHPDSAGVKLLLRELNTLHVEARPSAIVFVGSSQDGYIIRSDIVSFRLQHVRAFTSIYNITAPSAWVPALPVTQDLKTLLSSAIGAVIVQGSDQKDLESSLVKLSVELANKLNIPLTVAQPCPTVRVCVIGGGYSLKHRTSMLNGAAAIGMQLVIIDKSGHWMESQTEAREAFLAVDMAVDEGFCDRIVAACQQYGSQFDGITTFDDKYRVPTARAAGILGLPTESPDAFLTCTRKDEFRQLFPIENFPSFCATSVEDFQAKANELASHLPVIVKPRSGASSQGVNKADTMAEAEKLVGALVRSGSAALVEKYIDGPEVDVNIALIDGQIAFCNIVDQLPCSAELNGLKNAPASFKETTELYPSILPESERSASRETSLAALMKLGFKHGIFHMEARVIGSSVLWSRTSQTDLPYLEKRAIEKIEQPRAMLIEINPRTPGYAGALPALCRYGIDFSLVQLLLSVEDTSRARILSLPFGDQENTWVVTGFVATPRGGIFQGENMFEELRDRLPRLMENVIDIMMFFKDGDIIKDPSAQPSWIAFFIVKTENGHEEAVGICEDINKNLRFEIS